MKKTILIVGANSAFAKESVPVLSQHNTIITAGKKGCDIYCDVTEPVAIPDGVNVVINFAAVFAGSTDKEIINAQKTNVLGTLNVCIASKQAGVSHIINISSLSAVLDETSPYYTIYAITKRHADELAQFYCKLNSIPLTTLRPSQIYGDNSNFAKHQPFIYSVIDKAQKGEDILIYGNNDALRNYIHCGDLAEVLARIVARRTEGVYSCTYPSDVTYSQLACMAQKVFNKGGKVTFLKDKADIPDNIFPMDPSIYEKIDFYPQISLEEGIKRVKEYREGGSK